jgi:hypothetical protein
MARKPNYRFERVERERLQAERQARRDLRKGRGRDGTETSAQPTASESNDTASDDNLPDRHDA